MKMGSDWPVMAIMRSLTTRKGSQEPKAFTDTYPAACPQTFNDEPFVIESGAPSYTAVMAVYMLSRVSRS